MPEGATRTTASNTQDAIKYLMELEFILRNTSFKHGFDEADICQAFKTCRYMGQYGDRENVYLLLGFDTKANPVEILYNEIGERCVNVFHAMPCQNRFLRLFNPDISYSFYRCRAIRHIYCVALVMSPRHIV